VPTKWSAMIRINRSVLISVVLVVCTAVGCRQQSDGGKNAAARASHTKPGPEESFALIVETFRRGVEDVPIGFVLHDAEGHSMMTGRNEVSHKLIPPAKEGDPYKAVITVGSHSHYSIQRSTSEESVEEEQSDQQRRDSLAEEGPDTDIQVFDPELISPSSDKNQDRKTTPSTSETSEKTVTRRPDRQERHYELVYMDGKWTLITPLDPETEQSIQNAFKRALEMQI